tara:strand:+ start:240 stop:581 length:342 start_codon:yes stop_codon:yes gene_type:complete
MEELYNQIANIDGSGPNILRRLTGNTERFNNSDDDSGGGGGAGGAVIGIISFICLIIFLYAQYILLKCYCGKYFHFLFMTILLGCCPICVVPYLFYNHFVNKCGKGQIGKPLY